MLSSTSLYTKVVSQSYMQSTTRRQLRGRYLHYSTDRLLTASTVHGYSPFGMLAGLVILSIPRFGDRCTRVPSVDICLAMIFVGLYCWHEWIDLRATLALRITSYLGWISNGPPLQTAATVVAELSGTREPITRQHGQH
jgi:hypothetical protein